MRRILLASISIAALLVACGDATSLFPSSIVCRSQGDCPSSSTCDNGVCVGADGTPTRPVGDDRGTLDAGTGPASDTGTRPPLDSGGTPTLDVSVQDNGGTCTPSCAGRVCGDDGCGGSCGTCSGGQTCSAGVCGGGGGSGVSCADIITCVNACTDQACFEGCIAQGTPAAQSDFADIVNCLGDNCGDIPADDEDGFLQCQQDYCSGEINTCAGGGGGSGSDTCAQIIACVLACSDDACANTCVGNGTPAAQSAAVAFYNCAADACATVTSVAEFEECAELNCPSEAAACSAN